MGVTGPLGFRAAGVAAGIKSGGARDVALVVNDGPAPASAGVFTTNRVVAAPVTLSRAHLAAGTVRAVILNSGCANACTGATGADDSLATAIHVAGQLDMGANEVAVCSTGMIGIPLPMDALLAGATTAVTRLAGGPLAGADAADAIRTTDTVSKTCVVARQGWSVGGMAKGAGMLAPGLATMLCVITTDAVVGDVALHEALVEAVRTTFNRTDSDGCMSTNDTVLVLASGASGITVGQDDLTEALRETCADLARQLIADAEGASHDISITVVNAADEDGAEAVAKAVARSNLFKAAVFGNDPNWGRIVSEVGTVPEDIAPYDPQALDVIVNDVMVCRAGGVGEDRSSVDMTPRECRVVIDLHAGRASATVWTNDLTHDYVTENSAYSS
ncbi:bifunctional glutamate N-acetyltransferase/amino-acid acetyltransferase ArgJ [Schaalia sp. 19OD2882]|uniref:bifunctional glutamate N-acetyltransferase/amino-acid acetyltransferase ArgJ n=1 Tax=Schaalia sp. 19OD2882 TaxID=2794089 RepID=UPI001C1EA966|nr:bifunctional glutamate N-acetyltransferase/amino-acid acetyltransferase ArgJ [Schaalia sp. 19OD2882]QWW20678.1 bifunctional glutamate N-acetyltransferase/amino-acid acetyltransferase ArgJ [Schaalia sp. 19OD2882]